MSRILGLGLLVAGSASFAMAISVTTPEIDGGTAASAVVLLCGGLLILRSRRKK